MLQKLNIHYEGRLAKAVAQRIEQITAAHPLSGLEVDYLAEYVLEVHGLSSIDVQQPEAARNYITVLRWLEGTSRISPREYDQLRALYIQGINDIVTEVQNNGLCGIG